MELPPPPPHAAPGSGGALPPPPPAGAADGPPRSLLPPPADRSAAGTTSRLGPAWRWTLGIGWCIVLSGLGALAQSAFIVDADPWWLVFKPLPFALPVAMLLALVGDSRWTLPLSAASSALLWLLAVIDAAGGNIVVALGEAVCAAAGTLLTLAALLGREPASEPGVPDSVV